MVFNSVFFIFLFLPLFLLAYFTAKKEWRNFLIVMASMVFYFWDGNRSVMVLALCIIANYIFGLSIEKYRSQKTAPGEIISRNILIAAIIFNVALLAFFKYSNFILASLSNLSFFHFGGAGHTPLGISFFIFSLISYVVDVYRRKVAAQKNVIDFSMYAALFPKLIMGPIVRYADIAGTVKDRAITCRNFARGIERFIIGLSKKVLIADNVGIIADNFFNMRPDELSFGVAWLGMICYMIQIYFDFSGYSDMAIGLGKMMGFNFLENFNYPYISRSIREFWRRWHISLSSWFRDYLYIPLGGNRKGRIRTYLNLMAVFLLCGLWHGASWLFVIWGGWHGIFLVLERSPFGKFMDRRNAAFQRFYMLVVVMIGWVFFRADSFFQALNIFKNMFGLSGLSIAITPGLMNAKGLASLLLGIIFCIPIGQVLKAAAQKVKIADRAVLGGVAQEFKMCLLLLLFVVCLIFLSGATYSPFIYFNF